MRFAIPNPPRPVTLRQVPGAVGRLARAGAVAVAAIALLGWAGRALADRVREPRRFVERAEPIAGTVREVHLPRSQEAGSAGGEAVATIDVLYVAGGLQRTGSRIAAAADRAVQWRPGSAVQLLVDPANPDAPREETLARREAARGDLLPYGLGLGAALALLLLGRELRRTILSELEPLRRGLLVWLTPDGELPDTRAEIVFPASYYRDDVKYAVHARIRPGRAPVRNGPKLLATVVPSRPRWARVIDEDLAKALGWWGG